MRYVGIDLHKRSLVVAAMDHAGEVGRPVSIDCRNIPAIVEHFSKLRPFTCVIEASSSYYWLYELLEPIGEVKLAHPMRLRAIVSGRAKTDKLDARLLAKLLLADLIPTAYIPPRPYYELREIARGRARLARRMTEAKNELHTLLTRSNLHPPCRTIFSKTGARWLREVRLLGLGNRIKDELMERIEYYDRQLRSWDDELEKLRTSFPQTDALLGIHGIGLFSALLIVGELGEPWRFHNQRQAGAYAGLTARVSQSGEHCYHGHISRQGSPWLRWILVQAAMKVIRRDRHLQNFYTRIRKRSTFKNARVAVARKLAGICWLRLQYWHRTAA